MFAEVIAITISLLRCEYVHDLGPENSNMKHSKTFALVCVITFLLWKLWRDNAFTIVLSAVQHEKKNHSCRLASTFKTLIFF